MDINAKAYHIKRDGCLPEIPKRTPATYIKREFAGGVFKIHLTEKEYDDAFKPREIMVDNHKTCISLSNPSEYYLCYENEDGQEVKIRNYPRTL